MDKRSSRLFIVYDNLDVINVKSNEQCSEKEILFVVRYDFVRSSAKHDFYSNRVFNSKLDPLPDNTFDYYGIVCALKEDDFWGPLIKGINVVTLGASITDKEGDRMEMRFPNDQGMGIKLLFRYLKNLNVHNTHSYLLSTLIGKDDSWFVDPKLY